MSRRKTSAPRQVKPFSSAFVMDREVVCEEVMNAVYVEVIHRSGRHPERDFYEQGVRGKSGVVQWRPYLQVFHPLKRVVSRIKGVVRSSDDKTGVGHEHHY